MCDLCVQFQGHGPPGMLACHNQGNIGYVKVCDGGPRDCDTIRCSKAWLQLWAHKWHSPTCNTTGTFPVANQFLKEYNVTPINFMCMHVVATSATSVCIISVKVRSGEVKNGTSS